MELTRTSRPEPVSPTTYHIRDRYTGKWLGIYSSTPEFQTVNYTVQVRCTKTTFDPGGGKPSMEALLQLINRFVKPFPGTIGPYGNNPSAVNNVDNLDIIQVRGDESEVMDRDFWVNRLGTFRRLRDCFHIFGNNIFNAFQRMVVKRKMPVMVILSTAKEHYFMAEDTKAEFHGTFREIMDMYGDVILDYDIREDGTFSLGLADEHTVTAMKLQYGEQWSDWGYNFKWVAVREIQDRWDAMHDDLSGPPNDEFMLEYT